MSLPFTSLDAATAPGPGASRDLEGVFDHHTMLVTVTGDPTSMGVSLEGSHDGVIWNAIAGVSGSNDVLFATAPSSSAPGHLVRYVRANVTSLSGGSSPTVTATIASNTDQEE